MTFKTLYENLIILNIKELEEIIERTGEFKENCCED